MASAVKSNLDNAGFQCRVIHPNNGDNSFASIANVPEKIKSAYIATSPENTEMILSDLQNYGIEKVWLQNGSFDKAMLEKIRQQGIEYYTGCLMMYIPGTGGIHRFHRFLHELFAKK